MAGVGAVGLIMRLGFDDEANADVAVDTGLVFDLSGGGGVDFVADLDVAAREAGTALAEEAGLTGGRFADGETVFALDVVVVVGALIGFGVVVKPGSPHTSRSAPTSRPHPSGSLSPQPSNSG